MRYKNKPATLICMHTPLYTIKRSYKYHTNKVKEMTKMPTAEQAGFNSELTDLDQYPDEYKPLYIPTKLLKPNSLNPRTDADIAADDELRQSVGIRGVETPLHVRPLAEPDEDLSLIHISE